MENLMYFVVNYKDDSEKIIYMIPKSWILEKLPSLPCYSYAYYNPDTIDIKELPLDFLTKRICEKTREKQKGYVYKATIIQGFGKYFIQLIDHVRTSLIM